ncbi:MAG: hypothetical protein ACI8UD_003646 [Planctomycetota bacterium]|jgi:hypothetical protein
MNVPLRWASIALLFLSTSCAFHSTATHWNGLSDADGKPVFVKTTTNIGFNLLVIVPLFGNTSIDSMLDETTAEIAQEGGDRVRVIQSGTENYWYGWSPFTWIITPIVTDIALEYEPSQEQVTKVAEANTKRVARHQERANRDNSHVVPSSR